MIKCKECKFLVTIVHGKAIFNECHYNSPISDLAAGGSNLAIWPSLGSIDQNDKCCGKGVKLEKRKVNYGNRI